jgi:peptide-methionine (S)-S-oxide reductase
MPHPNAIAIAIIMLLGTNAFVIGQEPKAESRKKTEPKAKESKTSSTDTRTKSGTTGVAKKVGKSKMKTEKATFGGGCFWCLEAVFERVPGVKSVISGYAGGTYPHPTYELVQTGETGHAEVVQIEFDAETVTYDELLDVFWSCHDPTTLNRQGPDVGTEYRSIILYHNDEQKQAAMASYDKLTAQGVFADPIVTELAPLTKFFRAEPYHQNFYRRNPNAPYCRMMIAPKLKKLHLDTAKK